MSGKKKELVAATVRALAVLRGGLIRALTGLIRALTGLIRPFGPKPAWILRLRQVLR